MKWILFIGLVFGFWGAQAQTSGPVDFFVYQPAPGVVSFTDFVSTDEQFPTFGEREVKSFRIYYSKFGFDHITPESRFVEFNVETEFGTEGFFVRPAKIGNFSRPGDELFFKLSLIDENGKVIFVPGAVRPDPKRHSLVFR